MPFTLENLILVLDQIYGQLEVAKDADLILAIGSTGCGKSTMMTSLVFGPNALEIKTINKDIEIMDRDGNRKVKQKQFQYIDQCVNQGVFQIGHSNAVSMTFLP